MIKIMLVNSNRLKHPWPVIPFGLCCIAATLEKEGNSVSFLDLCFSQNPAYDIDSALKSFQPDILGISIRNIDNGAGYKPQFMLDAIRNEIIEPCKKAFLGPIIIGGPAVGISGTEILHFFDLEYAIRGDGEKAFIEFIHRWENDIPLHSMKGLIWKKGNQIIADNEPDRVHDLDALPYLNFSRYINLGKYRKFGSPLQIQTKRGCSFRCTYCTYNRIEGHEYRLRNPQKVADEIEQLVVENGIRHIEFTDSTFNIPLEHTKDLLRALISKNLAVQCRTMGLNPGAVDEELVNLMKKAGFQDVDLGAESCCDITLKSLGKNFTVEDVLKAGKLLRRKKIPSSWYLLVGAPGETPSTLQKTFSTITKAISKWDMVIIGIGIRVYNGSPIAKQLQSENPSCAKDNFLTPHSYSPEDIDLKTVKLITTRAFIQNPNFLMYDEYSQYPAFVIKTANALRNIIASDQPIWRVYVLCRYILKFLGVDFFSLLLFDARYGKILAKLYPQEIRHNSGKTSFYKRLLRFRKSFRRRS